MPHLWDASQASVQDYSWLPWQPVTSSNFEQQIEMYYNYVIQPLTKDTDIRLNLLSEDGRFYLEDANTHTKAEITLDKIIPLAMHRFLNVVNDLPKLKTICSNIEKMPLSNEDKMTMLEATLFFHHLLGLDPKDIKLEDIIKCLSSDTIRGAIPGTTAADVTKLKEFVTAHYEQIIELFTSMQIPKQDAATEPNIVITEAKTGAGLTSKVTAIKNHLSEAGTSTAKLDVAESPDMHVMQTLFGEPYTDQASAWNKKAAAGSPAADKEFGALMGLEPYLASLFGVERFMQFSREKFSESGVTHLISTTNFKPSVFISGLGPALGISVALISTNHLVPSAVIVAAETMPEAANTKAFIQDAEDTKPDGKYEVLGCPVDTAFKKLDQKDIVCNADQKLDTYHGMVAISLGGVHHMSAITDILNAIPTDSKKQYIIALGNNATDEVKGQLQAVAKEKGLNIGFADDFFGESGKKLTPQQMNMFYNASDFVIAKPGGSTTAELPAVGVPALFISIGAHNFMEKPNLDYLLRKHPESYQSVDSIGAIKDSPFFTSRPARFEPDAAAWQKILTDKFVIPHRSLDLRRGY